MEDAAAKPATKRVHERRIRASALPSMKQRESLYAKQIQRVNGELGRSISSQLFTDVMTDSARESMALRRQITKCILATALIARLRDFAREIAGV
jgi:hypothetical protein